MIFDEVMGIIWWIDLDCLHILDFFQTNSKSEMSKKIIKNLF